jgi:hypothetical protein
VDLLDPILGGVVRTVTGPLALACAVALAVLLARRLFAVPTGVAADPDGGSVTADAARAAVVLSAAWLLTTPYALPWYDAMVWGPLALLARLSVLALAYVPGRVVAMSADVERLTLGFRRETAPWLVLAGLVAVVGWAARRPPEPGSRRPEAPVPGRSRR